MTQRDEGVIKRGDFWSARMPRGDHMLNACAKTAPLAVSSFFPAHRTMDMQIENPLIK